MILDHVRDVALSVFSKDYAEARQKFLAAVPSAKAYACSAPGPSGEPLFTDVAYFGRPDAKRLLVLVSATHGVEGYCGSAGQLSFLKAGFHEDLPPSVGVLCIHALNCHGFAWDRRVTAEGCDLNRNFVDFSKPLPSNSGYEELAEYFVPADITPEAFERADDVLNAYKAEQGEQRYLEAMISGQFTSPDGMFYGGTEPTEARQLLEKIVDDFDVTSRDEVLVIDYHTGLGPYGYGELQCEQPSGMSGYERAVNIYGPSVTSPDIGNSSSVAIVGPQDAYWERILGNRHTYVALEFGTVPIAGIVDAVRHDHSLSMHRPGEIDSEIGRRVRLGTKLAFYPQGDDWKELVVGRCHVVHRQAMAALTS